MFCSSQHSCIKRKFKGNNGQYFVSFRVILKPKFSKNLHVLAIVIRIVSLVLQFNLFLLLSYLDLEI